VAERPDFLPTWVGLAELYLRQERWDEVERAARQLEADASAPVEAAVFRGRAHLAHREFPKTQALLRGAIAAAPRAQWPRGILSRALLQESHDLDAAEEALRDALAWTRATPRRATTSMASCKTRSGRPPTGG
jgi:hypothetical protein